MQKLILRNFQSPGDIVMLTAAVRDLHRCYPGRFQTDVRTSCPALWENNPHLVPLQEDGPDVEVLDCDYPLIHRSNDTPCHHFRDRIEFVRSARTGTIIRRSILALLALLAFSACGPDLNLDAGEQLHPTDENAPPADAALITVGSEPVGLSAEALAEWRAARDRLLGARTTLALGTNRGEGPELFGRIGDVTFDRDGNVVVLDAVNYDVRVFRPDGSHLLSFGREGEGPMEFDTRPHSVTVLSDGRLLVGMRAEMKVFAPVAGGYEYLDRIAVPSRDMCVSAAGRVFVTVHHTRTSDRVLHEVDLTGDTTLSFGHWYLHEQWLFRNQLSDGTIACLDDPPAVLFAFSEHPILRLHRPGEDEPAWTAALEDYVQPFYAGAIDGSSIRMLSNSAELVDKPHTLGENHIVLQTGYRRLLSLRARTYLVDAATGQGALISEDFPRIMRMFPGRFVAGWNDPYPRIEVREIP